jgi:hypothetical protein
VNTPFIGKQRPRETKKMQLFAIGELFQKLLDMDLTLEDEQLGRLNAETFQRCQ